MSEDKYKLFRNYMANELGIGRDDIKTWTQEAVEIEVRRVIASSNIEGAIAAEVKRQCTDYGTSMHRDIRKQVGDALAERITLALRAEST